MYHIKCPVCKSSHVQKNGRRNGQQLYRCRDCHHQFRNSRILSKDTLWEAYQQNKQTVSELASSYRVSPSTVKRRLSEVTKEWSQPPLSGDGHVHLDATYWGRGFGVLLALEESSGFPLYMSFIKSETVADYQDAVDSIESRGYRIRGLVIDGKQSLFGIFSPRKIQMCQFHMKQIIRRYLTLNPKLKVARALKDLMETLTSAKKEEFTASYEQWKQDWRETLNRRSTLKSGKTQYTHRRLRSAMHSLDFYLPYLFTYQEPGCQGMPNTNNKIEGTFTDLKKNLNNHSGKTEVNRKRFICGFFLALAANPNMKKQDRPS